MPWTYDSDTVIGPRFPRGQAEPEIKAPAGPEYIFDADDPMAALGRNVGRVGDILGAAATRQNLPYSAYRYLRDRAGLTPDPNHNPLDIIAGTKYEAEYLDNFLTSRSEPETRMIMKRIDEEEAARKTLESAGAFGVVAEIGMGLADPTIFLPGTLFLKAGRAGWSVARGAAGVAGAAALQAGVQEGALYATQETRTLGEVAMNVGTATLLGGFLGAGAGLVIGRSERRAVEAALDLDREDWAADLMPRALGADVPRGPTVVPAPDHGEALQRFIDEATDPAIKAQRETALASRDDISGVDLDFGPVLHGYEDRWSDAVARLQALQGGDARGVLYQVGLGRADVVWGKAGSDGYGLAKIAVKHPEVLADLPERLSRMKREVQRGNFVRFKNPETGETAVFALDYHGRQKTWLLTAFDPNARPDRGVVEGADSSLGRDPSSQDRPGDESIGSPEPEVDHPRSAAQGGSTVGASAVERRQLQLRGFYLDKLPGLRTVMQRISPTMRVFSSGFVSARRALADLAETPLRFEEHAEGVATTQGPAVDRAARMITQRARAETGAKIDQLYARYRFGKTETGFLGSQVAKVRGAVDRASEKMSPLEFREAIGRAMRRADTSDTPEVQEAAQFIRRTVFEPLKERAIRAGLLPEDVDVETADSWLMRVWNKQIIDARRPDIQGKIADWLGSEQANKAGIKERLTALTDEIDALQARIEKAEANSATAADHVVELNSLLKKVEDEVTAWKGKSAWEAEKAIEARVAKEAERPEGAPRLQSADKAVGRAVRRMLAADTDLTPEEVFKRAGEIVDRLTDSPDGRLAYDAPSGGPHVGRTGDGPAPRGPLATRDFMIPDLNVEEFLVSDIDEILQTYLRSIVPDILLTERFGDVDMTEAFKRLREEHEAKALAATSEKARKALKGEYDAVVKRLAAIRDRIRNVYGVDPKMRNLARATAAVKTYNMLTDLGGVTITSLTDMAGPIFLHGFGKVLGDGWRPFLKNAMGIRTGYAAARQQYKAMGIAVETQLASRMNDAYSLVDLYRSSTKAERVLSATSDAYFIGTLLGPWTDFGKTVTAVVSGNEIFRAAKAVSEGKATKKQIENLAASNIDAAMAGRIWRQFEGGGETIDGVHIPNTADWSDRGARDAFEGAVGKEADQAILTPGQEKPLWMNSPIASLLGQYKSFAAAATERYLIAGLQRSDAAVLSGLTAGVAAGMIGYAVYSLLTGRELSDNPADWIREGLSRSSAFGWFEEANGFTGKFGIDAYRLMGSKRPLSKYAARSAFSQLLGPTGGKIEGLFGVAGSVSNGSWSAADTRRLRRMVAFQNLFYVRKLFDQLEDGTNSLLGVEPKQ